MQKAQEKGLPILQVKCPTCSNNAELSAQFGYIACKNCRDQEKPLSERTYEMVPDRIKEDRIKHKNSMIQPFRNGQVSKEYLDLYGSSRIQVTPEEIKNAKNVWGELEYYK